MNDDYFSEEQSQIFIGRPFLLLASNRKIQAFNSCQSGTHLEPIQKTHFWPVKQNVWFYMLKKPLFVDSKFYSEELDLKGKTKVRIFFFFSSLRAKSVCNLSVGEVKELTEHLSLDMIAKNHILFFVYLIGILVVYWTKDKTGGANPLPLKV